MKRTLLVRCEFQGDTFCALWLDEAGDYVLGWMVGVSPVWGEQPAASSKMRFKDRVQAAEALETKLVELRQMIL